MDKNSEEQMKKLINELLDILRSYDFTNDIPMEISKKAESFSEFIWMTGMEKYFAFKTQIYPQTLFDPDSQSEILQLLYEFLWDSEILELCKKGGRIKGDTINSVANSLNKFVNAPNNSIKQCQKKFESGDEKKFEYKPLVDFVNSYHTLGNFIPVPPTSSPKSPLGFNRERATYGGKVKSPKDTRKDYWYITLLDIYHYYQKDETKKAEWEWLEKYKDWLEAFGDWNNFIEQNYLQVYVAKNRNDDYSAPLSLFLSPDKFKEFSKAFKDDKDELKNMNPSTEDFLNELKEISEDELKNFFENATYCIEERTERMIDALRKRLDELFD